jgi:vacuolar-type H+-ATPase subunit H
MSNGSAGQVEAASSRADSFFDKTESNYRNVNQRSFEARERIDKICDAIAGGQPREANALVKADGQDRHPAAFDRCNAAEQDMYSGLNMLEESIQRLENLGLL